MEMRDLVNGKSITLGSTKFSLVQEGDHYKLTCHGNDVAFIKYICDYLNNNYSFQFDILINNAKCKNKYSVSYESLQPYAEKIHFKYGSDWDAVTSYDEFIPYQKKLSELVANMNATNPSPLEKLMMAYDFVKQKPYHFSDDASLHGLPHYVLNGDSVVCRGYCLLMQELLFDDDRININDISFTVYDKKGHPVDYHNRSLVVLDDDKYAIHGCFFMDPTADSYKEELKEYFGHDIKPQDLYVFFLKSVLDREIYSDEDYEYRIPNMQTDNDLSLDDHSFHQSQPEVLPILLSHEKDNISYFLEDSLGNVFRKYSTEQIQQYVKGGNISFETLLEAVKNVRLKCGYSPEQVIEEVERVRKFNEDLFGMDAIKKTV